MNSTALRATASLYQAALSTGRVRSCVSKSGPHQPVPLISGAGDRLPLAQSICDQLRALLIILFVKRSPVPGLGAQVYTGRPCVEFRPASREVPSRAISGLQSNLSRPV